MERCIHGSMYIEVCIYRDICGGMYIWRHVYMEVRCVYIYGGMYIWRNICMEVCRYGNMYI